MHYIGNYLLWALAACILRQGSFAEDQSGYICLIDDPKQNQCDSICLTELSPRLSEVVKAQNEGNTKLETLEVKIGQVQLRGKLGSVENRLNRRLQGVESKLVGQLQGVENKLEGHLQEVQTKVEAKLEKSLHEVNTKLEGQLQGVENNFEGRLQGLERQLQEVQTKLEAKLDESVQAIQKIIENQLQAVEDAATVETQVHPISNKTAVPQQPAKAPVPALSTITIPSGFELIGNRYFHISNYSVDWETAERRCRVMGGYLAAFRNEEEFNAITPKQGNRFHWLGINDREKEGHFVSVASQEEAPFLKWDKGEPSDIVYQENCVCLIRGRMWDNPCSNPLYFICQADNET